LGAAGGTRPVTVLEHGQRPVLQADFLSQLVSPVGAHGPGRGFWTDLGLALEKAPCRADAMKAVPAAGADLIQTLANAKDRIKTARLGGEFILRGKKAGAPRCPDDRDRGRLANVVLRAMRASQGL